MKYIHKKKNEISFFNFQLSIFNFRFSTFNFQWIYILSFFNFEIPKCGPFVLIFSTFKIAKHCFFWCFFWLSQSLIWAIFGLFFNFKIAQSRHKYRKIFTIFCNIFFIYRSQNVQWSCKNEAYFFSWNSMVQKWYGHLLWKQ